jgi:uncharacterized membrane protein (UPF0127 family)
MMSGRAWLAIVVVHLAVVPTGCERVVGGRNDLASMEKGIVTINGHPFDVRVARTSTELQRGLMYVEREELGPDQGMWFVFDREELRSFWMANTPQALDIAFVRTDGTIVHITTMRAYDRSHYSSIEPARYALEVRAGRLAELGIGVGDKAVGPS